MSSLDTFDKNNKFRVATYVFWSESKTFWVYDYFIQKVRKVSLKSLEDAWVYRQNNDGSSLFISQMETKIEVYPAELRSIAGIPEKAKTIIIAYVKDPLRDWSKINMNTDAMEIFIENKDTTLSVGPN